MSDFYQSYIANSAKWEAIREEMLARAGGRCNDCGGTERLEVHHLTYDRLGNERLEDLQVLCHWCHQLEHGRPVTGAGPVAGPSQAELTRRAMNTVSLFRYQERMYALSQAAQGAELMRAGWELVWTFDPDIGETVRAEAEKELAKLERRIDRMIDRAAPQVVV